MSKGTSSKILEEIKRIEDVPGFVYLIRNKDLYKIGITISMKRRVKELKPDEVVAVKEAANMRGIEKLLHKRYKERRIPQTEYFRLTPEEVEEASYLLGKEICLRTTVNQFWTKRPKRQGDIPTSRKSRIESTPLARRKPS